MDQIDEVLRAENALLNALRSGELKTYNQLRSRIEAAIEAGLVSIDYQVSNREVYILDCSNVMTTLTAIETTHMRDGQSTTSPTTIISILWRKINTKWWLAYLHASEKPGDPSNPVWKEG